MGRDTDSFNKVVVEKKPDAAKEASEGKQAEEKFRNVVRDVSDKERDDAAKARRDTSEQFLPTLKVDGTVAKKNADGSVTETQVDGTKTTFRYNEKGEPAGKEVVSPRGVVTTYDANDKISEVKTAQGEIRRFERGQDGTVTRITESGGSEWTSADGETFEMKGAGVKVKGELHIGADGSYSFKTDATHELRRNADGSVSQLESGKERSRTFNDGSGIALNDKGQVTDTTDAAGKRRSFEYGADGKVSAVMEPDGGRWVSRDGKHWQKEGSRDTRTGDVKVSTDGSYTVAGNNGRETTFKIDGSQVARDKEGHVLSVKDRYGQERRFGYNDKGEMTSLREPNGEVWTSGDGKVWKKEGSNKTWNGQLSVEHDGDYHAKIPDGREIVARTDGWKEGRLNGQVEKATHEEANGIVVTKNGVGQVTEIKDARGGLHKFGYDDSGRMNQLTEPSGAVWKSTDGKTWTKSGNGERREFQVDTSDSGAYRRRDADGSQHFFKMDGSSLAKDAQGRVTEMTTATGKVRSFDYGADGKINKIVDADKSAWTTTDGQTWKKEGTDKKWQGTISIHPDGHYEEKSAASGVRTTHLTDGRTIARDKDGKLVRADSADGQVTRYEYDEKGKPKGFEISGNDKSAVTLDGQGRVSKTTDANGVVREFGYGADGKPNKVVENGKTWSTTDGQSWTSDKGDKWSGQVFVGQDGRYAYTEGKNFVIKRPDGKIETKEPSGASRVENNKGQILETTDAKGVKRSYEYDAQGRVSKLNDNGTVWETKDGSNWTKNGESQPSWRGKVSVEKDGTYFQENAAGDREWRKPDGSKQLVNYAQMEAACQALNDSTYWSITEGGTDEKKFFAALEGKSVAERQMMDEIYQRKFGKSIEKEAQDEMEGGDQETALALLKKGDGADNAGAIRVALTEKGQIFEGRSGSECERVVRDTLETMSRDEIAETNRQYMERYGTTLYEAVLSDPNLSEKTKEACRVYFKGHDKRTADDVIKIGQLACEEGDSIMFQEAMRRAPKKAREYFASGPGQKEIKDAFEGHWYTLGIFGNATDTELRNVQDYAQYGKLSAATQVKDNTSWLGDNEQAIEQSLNKMTEVERKDYLLGKSLSNQQPAPENLSADQQRAVTYYKDVSGALHSAAGHFFSGDSQNNEFKKWEDMIAHKGGSLVSRLAEHRGDIYDSSMHDVLATIENMPKEDWDRLKNEPGYREQIDTVLKTYLNDDERSRCLALLEEKSKSESFEDSQQKRRPLLDALNDNTAWYNTSEDNVYKAIESMTAAEQEAYRTDKDGFRDKLDTRLREILDADENTVASGLLAKVDRHEKPEMTILDKLHVHATHVDADEAKIIRDMQEAFKQDPSLRERIVNPQTEEDRKFAEDFKQTAMTAMGSNDFDRYAKPLIETGHLGIELQMELNQGIFDDDQQGTYTDVQSVSESEKQRILTDAAFRDRVLGHLNADEQKIALNSMAQGEMRAEDKLYSYMVGAGTSEQEIKDVLTQIKDRNQYLQAGVPEDQVDGAIKARLDEVKREFARKYGKDLSAEFVAELGGKDLREVERLKDQRSAREEFLFAQDQSSLARSGFGSGFVDAVWDGTGFQMDDDRNSLARAMVMEPENVHAYADQLYKSIDLHSQSKEALADAIVDTTIAVAAVGGAFFTGGISLSLLAYTAVGGAMFKVGTKGLIMGNDYDWTGSQVLVDGASGFVDGGLSLWGGGMLAVGRNAGVKAAQETIEAGGKVLLREGAEQALKREAGELVVKGLQAQAKGISDDAIKQLARKYAKEGSEEALEQMLKKSLTQTVETESKAWVRRLATEMADNALAGGIGGGASGAVRGAFTAENFDQFMQMTATSAGFGAFGGAAFTVAAKPIGWGVGKVRGRFGKAASEAIEEASDGTGGAYTAADSMAQSTAAGRHVSEPVSDGGGNSQNLERSANDSATADGGTEQGALNRAANERPIDTQSSKPESLEELDARQKRMDEAEARMRERLPIEENLDAVRLRQISEEISTKFRDKPIAREEFEKFFDSFPAEKRQLAQQVVEQSIPNMTSRGVDAQMLKLREQIADWKLKRLSKPDGQGGYKEVDSITIYVLDSTSDANALAHQFHKATGIEPQIEILAGPHMDEITRLGKSIDNLKAQGADRRAIAKVQEKLDKFVKDLPDNAILFDNPALATRGQLEVMSRVKNLAAVDSNGFTRGPNVYDFAAMGGGAEAMSRKVNEVMKHVDSMQAAGISRDDAVRYAMSRDMDQVNIRARDLEKQGVAPDEALKSALASDAGTAKQYLPKAREISTEGAVTTRSDIRRSVDGGDRYFERSLYDELTQPKASPEQVQDFLGRLSAEQQIAAARFLRDGTHYNSYTDMLTQAKELHANILKSVPDGNPENILIVTGMEGSGSSYLVNHLYARANGLKPDNFVSIDELRHLRDALDDKSGGRTLGLKVQEKLKGKRLVFVDDYAASGNQIPKLLNRWEREMFAGLVDKEGRRLVDGVTVGTLGRYEVPLNRNPWDNRIDYPYLHPNSNHSNLPVTVGDSPAMYRDPFAPGGAMEDLKPFFDAEMGGTKPLYSSSSVSTAVVTPYGGPNNNVPFLQGFLETPEGLNLPKRYPDINWWARLFGH